MDVCGRAVSGCWAEDVVGRFGAEGEAGRGVSGGRKEVVRRELRRAYQSCRSWVWLIET